ncbi:MAG: YraN family protein [Thermoguttaceae bacterium]|nr:YraN family protein [Thermoguttaceae bacterium]MBP3694310.1 YraN family protein [Thermoguttaceae bacterium]
MRFWDRLKEIFRTSSGNCVSFPEEVLRERLPLGQNCERITRWYLENHVGMKCIGQNVRTRRQTGSGNISGELDLIMEFPIPNSPVIFVEVRSRSQYWDRFGTPLQSISGRKQMKICHAARLWLQEKQIPMERPVRFDVVSVIWPPDEKPTLCHIPNAFTWQTMVWQKHSVTQWDP